MFENSKPLHPPTEIKTNAPWVTEITFLHCAEDKQANIVEVCSTYAERLALQPGFVALNVLRSTDESRVCLYHQWHNEQDLTTARQALGEGGYEALVETDSGGARL